MSEQPWWRGARGEWYVVGQFALGALVIFGPRRVAGWPAGHIPVWPACQKWGTGFMIAGTVFFTTGIIWQGPRISALPRPPAGARLVRTGPYSLARHPIYSGLLLTALGWALFLGSWLTLLYVAAAFVLLDVKSRREERWLVQKFPEYRDYQRRVWRFIPFVY